MPTNSHGSRARLLAGACAVAALAAAHAPAVLADEPVQLHEMTVTGTREGELKSETPASVSIIKGGTIEAVKPAHASEIMSRVPGAVIMQTNGEGHTTGIRQPIGTDAVYLYLENGVPTRATGFFNHNAMFEIDLPNAEGLEVTRGPGSALQGSDAIGAVFNVTTKAPSATPEAQVTAEGGSYGWSRLLGTASDSWGDTGARGSVNMTHTDGWRRRTEYDRQSVTLQADHALRGNAMIRGMITATNADMQTGANARLTKADYLDNPTANYHTIAYRRVQAMRASVAYEAEDGPSLFSVTPFLRWNAMELLPSFTLSSDPYISYTGHQSLGLQAKYRRDFEPWRSRVVTGVDLDYSPGSHVEDRIIRTKSGENYVAYTKTGTTYDYEVLYKQASPFIHVEASPVSPVRLSGGLRADFISYDYDNNKGSSGAFTTTKADGSAGTTTLYRPASTERYYSHLSPSLGATWSVVPALNVFGRYKHSFRAPSEGQLFRSGSNVDTIHLSPVKVDNYEMGLRGPDTGAFTWEASAYRMTKRDDILSTRESGTVSSSTNNGKTRHQGVEGAVNWRFLPDWEVGANGTYARHRYMTWVSGGTDYSGNDISSAPRVVTNATLAWKPQMEALKGLKIEGEWTHLGPYKMDDANTNTYQGHHLFNLRGAYALTESVELFGRVMNLMDARWATIAQYTSNREEFAPGMPRTLFGGVTVRF